MRDGEVKFHPERWTQTYLTWMDNLKDWCISRQLWWGHRIPVFYCEDCGWEDALMEDADVCPKCGGHHVHQDEDVLDTWFSSSQLWTFATQGWPDDASELAEHHPTKVLVTARDIIALWVARMIMSSLYFTDEVPFHDVYIYATILAKDGSRMSKSKGNGVDPMELMEKYGADAMRYNLLTLITNNQDVKFDANIDKKTHKLIDSPRTEQARGFVTKIWNASRFVQMNLEGYAPGAPAAVTPEDAWMLSRLARAVAHATEQLETYAFGDYAREIQSFFWGDVCDWYIELCKSRLLDGAPEERLQVQRNLVFVLDTCMRLLHPVMPFVTESVWDALPASGLDDHSAEFLMVAAWPEPERFAEFVNERAEKDFELAKRVISCVRSTRARYRLSPRAELDVHRALRRRRRPRCSPARRASCAPWATWGRSSPPTTPRSRRAASRWPTARSRSSSTWATSWTSPPSLRVSRRSSPRPRRTSRAWSGPSPTRASSPRRRPPSSRRSARRPPSSRPRSSS